jgi:predicted SAM-dependent methyltransferase
MGDLVPPSALQGLFNRAVRALPMSLRDRYRKSFHSLRESYQGLRRRFSPPQFPQNAHGKIFVNLGCGELNNPHFVNVDTSPWQHVHYVHSVDSLPMFEPETVDLIYCSHCLEHIPHHQTAQVLREWNRVLKLGGVLKLAVPNIDAVIRFYQENPDRFEEAQWYFMGAQTYPANFHYAIFNAARLTQLLEAAGFGEVRAWKHEDAPELAIDDCSRMMLESRGGPIALSLNLLGVKKSAPTAGPAL